MNDEWKRKNMPIRYQVRDEIEEIIKEKNIDRKRFYEFSKSRYSEIIDKFYYSFFEYKDRRKPASDELSYLWLRFQKQLNHSKSVYLDWSYEDFIDSINQVMPDFDESKMYYLILCHGWVYEGYISEIISILVETDRWIDDFYIVSKKFDWLICYCEDGDCLFSVSK